MDISGNLLGNVTPFDHNPVGRRHVATIRIGGGFSREDLVNALSRCSAGAWAEDVQERQGYLMNILSGAGVMTKDDIERLLTDVSLHLTAIQAAREKRRAAVVQRTSAPAGTSSKPPYRNKPRQRRG